MSLQLNGVRKSYGTTPVLDDVTLALEAREFIAFLRRRPHGRATAAAADQIGMHACNRRQQLSLAFGWACFRPGLEDQWVAPRR